MGRGCGWPACGSAFRPPVPLRTGANRNIAERGAHDVHGLRLAVAPVAEFIGNPFARQRDGTVTPKRRQVDKDLPATMGGRDEAEAPVVVP